MGDCMIGLMAGYIGGLLGTLAALVLWSVRAVLIDFLRRSLRDL